MKRIQPIPISQILIQRYEIPDLVILIFNTMLQEHWDGEQAIIYKDEVIKKLSCVFGKSEDELLTLHWLDIEPKYRQAGYIVTYNAPQYGENKRAYFKFNKTN